MKEKITHNFEKSLATKDPEVRQKRMSLIPGSLAKEFLSNFHQSVDVLNRSVSTTNDFDFSKDRLQDSRGPSFRKFDDSVLSKRVPFKKSKFHEKRNSADNGQLLNMQKKWVRSH